jgi:hypothetical protein
VLGELEAVGHVVHAPVPVVSLYVPATHAVHMPPFGPEKPVLQVHADGSELEIGELESAGHARQVNTLVAATAVEYVFPPQVLHTAVPVTVLYVPATHAVHGPPIGPV